MNIQQRTAKTLSPPGQSATPDRRSSASHQWLRAHEDSLAVTYENVGVGIAEIDQAGRMLRVNQKVCELTGREAADLLGRSIFDETSPQDVAQDLGSSGDRSRAKSIATPSKSVSPARTVHISGRR
jgi:PAS domain-containing protein